MVGFSLKKKKKVWSISLRKGLSGALDTVIPETDPNFHSFSISDQSTLTWSRVNVPWVFPGGASGKEPTCQCRRARFHPWVKKIPWRRAWQPTPVFSNILEVHRTEEPGGPWSLGSQRGRHDWSDLTHTQAHTHTHTHTHTCVPWM